MALTAFLDTNVLIRHLTGDPPGLAHRASRYLADTDELRLVDVVFAECVFVLESIYALPRPRVSELMRSVLAFPAMRIAERSLLRRALEVYEHDRIDFAEAYLVACAEDAGDDATVTSFDRTIDRVEGVRRIEP